MNTSIYILFLATFSYPSQAESIETFKLASCIYDIECINNDKSLNDCIENLKKIDRIKLNTNNSNLLDYFIKDLTELNKMDNQFRNLRYKKLAEQLARFSSVNRINDNGNFADFNMKQLDYELKDLTDLFGPDSYWVYNFRTNFIISKLIRKNNDKILDDIKLIEEILERNKIRNSILGAHPDCLYCLFFENKSDWSSCEKYAIESLDKFPVQFNQNYLVSPVSFLIKSRFLLKKYDRIEECVKILGYSYITDLDNKKHVPLFRINETLAKYYHIKGKLTNAISHQEIALAHISRLAPKDSEEVKAVATDLRNMLKQNNEIQAMRNLEERYNLKPLP